MRPAAVALLLALALTPLSAVADKAPPPSPPAAASPHGGLSWVQVRLHQARKLRLVKIPGGKVALDGVLEATIENTGASAIKLRDLELHGLRFSGKGGVSHVIVHSCKCVQDVAEPQKGVYELRPGASRKVVVDDWGCGGGMFEAPPVGSYEVVYRVLAAPEKSPAPRPEASPLTVTRECKQELAGEAMWVGAAVSPPIVVTLKKAVPLKRR